MGKQWQSLEEIRPNNERHRQFVQMVLDKQLSHRELARIFSGGSINLISEQNVRHLIRRGTEPLPGYPELWMQEHEKHRD